MSDAENYEMTDEELAAALEVTVDELNDLYDFARERVDELIDEEEANNE